MAVGLGLLIVLNGLFCNLVWSWLKNGDENEDLGGFEDAFGTLNRLEGQLTLALEKMDEAISEIEPPTIAESLTGMAHIWMQQRMMQQFSTDAMIKGPAGAEAAQWPDVEPQKDEPDAAR